MDSPEPEVKVVPIPSDVLDVLRGIPKELLPHLKINEHLKGALAATSSLAGSRYRRITAAAIHNKPAADAIDPEAPLHNDGFRTLRLIVLGGPSTTVQTDTLFEEIRAKVRAHGVAPRLVMPLAVSLYGLAKALLTPDNGKQSRLISDFLAKTWMKGVPVIGITNGQMIYAIPPTT